MADKKQPAPFEMPADLTTLAPEELAAKLEAARTEFDAIYNREGGPQVSDLARANEMADAIDAFNTEENRRTEEAAKTKADFDALMARVKPADVTEPVEGEVIEGELVDAGAGAAPVAASGRPAGGAVTASRELGGLKPQPRVNPSLSAAQRVAPTSTAPQQKLAITASAELPGRLSAGATIDSIETLADLLHERARSLPVVASYGSRDGSPYGGLNVARIRHSYDDVFAENPAVASVEAYRDKLSVMRRPQEMAGLVAAGGWCAPSQIQYDFFNVACAGGQLDLPTFGVQRGGLRWPVSPSLADTFTPAVAPFNGNAPGLTTMPWVWTEINDVVAATGGAGLTTKPCIRVPCPGFNEARLECYGVCVTAGNLADNAYPESTRNWLRLLDVAFQHTMNYRYIQTIRNLTSDGGTISCTGSGAASPFLDAIELAAFDYRKRYVMCVDDVVEVIAPEWIVPVIRADLGKRTGVDFVSVTDQMISAWFDNRHVRVQLVDDYQVRGANQPGASAIQTTWPATVEFMLWAPGTFALGNGMNLDLGVVRDSVLNATNDHTAAWYEQCHLIAQFGHQGRRYVVPLCTSGVTGAANMTACCV